VQHIALILTSLAIGVVLRITGRLPDTAANALSGWVINVALPAAAINSVHGLTFNADWWLAAATPWIGVALAIVVIVPLCRALGWSRQRVGALVLVGGWGNTAFVGLPMIAAFAGEQWLSRPRHRPFRLLSCAVHSGHRNRQLHERGPIPLAGSRETDRDLPALSSNPDRARHRSP
jgi:hypothetical protein